MSDHGSSTATATDLSTNTGFFSVEGNFSDGTDSDYFKITISDAVNRLDIWSQAYFNFSNSSYANIYVELIDINETVISGEVASYTTFSRIESIVYENLPVGDYWIRLYTSGFNGTIPIDYVLFIDLRETQTELDKGIRDTNAVISLIGFDNPISGIADPVLNEIDSDGIIQNELNFGMKDYVISDTVLIDSLVFGSWPRPKKLYTGISKLSQPLRMNNYGRSFSSDLGEIPSSPVTKDSNPSVGNLIRLYDRVSGEMVDYTYTDAAGNYSFPSGLTVGDKYFIVAFDDVDAPTLEAKVNDFIDPQPATYSL